MVQRFRQTFRFNRGYWPAQPLAGEANGTIFRGENMLLRGGEELVYAEAFRGWNDGGGAPFGYGVADPLRRDDLSASIPSSPNAAITLSAPSEGETGTMFGLTSLPLSLSSHHTIMLNNKLYIVRDRLSRQSYLNVTPVLPGDGFSGTGYRPRIVQDLGADLATMTAGSIIRLARGHILGVGAGEVRVNSASTGFILSERLQLALQSSSPGTYTVYSVGLSQPTLTTVTAIAGGTKNMQAGTYSFRIARYRSATGGYGNPSEAKEVTIVTGQRMQVTFPAMIAGQDGWLVFATLYSADEGITGPWYFLDAVEPGEVSSGGGTKIYEYRNYEIAGSDLATFDNDPPPTAAFVTMLGGIPLLLGCGGLRPALVGVGGDDYFPGPVIRPGRPGNPEAYPATAAVSVSPPEDILGFVEGQGRVYVMTRNRLHIITLTGDDSSPVTTRPFWRSGFTNPRCLVFVNGRLYGFTSRGPVRSGEDGNFGDEDQSFAAPVASEMNNWYSERVTVAVDFSNQMVAFFHANDHVNAQGYWVTKVLLYSERLGVWSPPIIISSSSAHMVVSSATAVGGRLFFVANDNLYRWDDGSNSVPWYLATPFCDQNAEALDKEITGFSATIRGSGITAGIHASGSEEEAPITELETSNATCASETINLGSPSGIKSSEWLPLNVREKRLFAVRVDGQFSGGSGDRDRVDEIVIEGAVSTPRH